MEQWKNILGYKGLYQVSNLGRVRSLPRITRGSSGYLRHISGKIRKPYIHKGDDEVRVSLYQAHGKEHTVNLSKLVAKAFLPNPHHYRMVAHLNHSSRDNRAVNLQWVSVHQKRLTNLQKSHTTSIILVGKHKHTFSSEVQASWWLKRNLGLSSQIKSIATILSRDITKHKLAYGFQIINHSHRRKKPSYISYEQWRKIKGYPGYYVSNLGRVKSADRTIIAKDGRPQHRHGRILKAFHHYGYLGVRLCVHDHTKGYLVHRLVAQAFIPNPHHYPDINHRDENRSNNRVSNLEWCTAKYNNNYGDFSKRISHSNGYPVTLKKYNLVMTFSSLYKASLYLKFHCHLTVKPNTIRIKLIHSCRKHIPVYGYQARYVNHRSRMPGKYTSIIKLNN